ncbi:MAG: hypothetical protein LBI56_02075 [Puniceicoccales bacterium]|jgi:hypothetical protein|nr:hypothetical protein [Puniceicoccales bacterium]
MNRAEEEEDEDESETPCRTSSLILASFFAFSANHSLFVAHTLGSIEIKMENFWLKKYKKTTFGQCIYVCDFRH